MFQKLERGMTSLSQSITQAASNLQTFIAGSFNRFINAAESRRRRTIAYIGNVLNQFSETILKLLQIQNQKISAHLNDLGPYQPDDEIHHPQTANIWHTLVVNFAAIPFIIIGLVIYNTQAGFRFALNEFGHRLGLFKKAELPLPNQNLFATLLHRSFIFLASLSILAPSFLILIMENMISFPVALFNGLFSNNFEWGNENLQANTRISQYLGFGLGDALKLFFQGLSEGFARVRNLAYANESIDFNPTKSPLSFLTYWLGLITSVIFGLCTLIAFDMLIIGGFKIIERSIMQAFKLVYPNDDATEPLALKTWQKINPVWFLALPIFIMTFLMSGLIRLSYQSLKGIVLGLSKGFTNVIPDLNYEKTNNNVDWMFKGLSQTIEKTINLVISTILYATVLNILRHFAQGTINAFNIIFPSKKTELNFTNNLNLLENKNYLVKNIGQGLGLTIGGVFFTTARSSYSVIRGLGLGFVNGMRQSIYLEPLKSPESRDPINQSFNRIANVFEQLIVFPMTKLSQMLIEGGLIKPTQMILKSLEDSFIKVFPSNQMHKIFEEDVEIKPIHFLSNIIGIPLAKLAYSLNYVVMATGRFCYQVGKGCFNGLINGTKIGLDLAPDLTETSHPTHATDIFFHNIFRLTTAIMKFPGLLVGGVLYNLPTFVNGITYPSRQVYNDEKKRNQYFIFDNLHKKRGFPGQTLGAIVGIPFAFGVAIYRILGNTMISFYHSFSYPIAEALESTRFKSMIKTTENRSSLAQKFGIIGNFGVIPGFILGSLILFARHVPRFIAGQVQFGFIKGLFAWFDQDPIMANIDVPILAMPLHLIARVIGNMLGFIYNNFANINWLIGFSIAAAYTDKGQENPVDFSQKSPYQKTLGRIVPIVLFIPVTTVMLSLISLWRTLEQNIKNISFSVQSGYETSSPLNPKQTTFEKVLSIPSIIIGFTIGFMAKMIVNGAKVLRDIIKASVNNFQFGLRQGLKPFVDDKHLIAEKPYNYAAFPIIVVSFMIGAIIGIINNARLAIRFNFLQAIAWAYADKDTKNVDSFAQKSMLRQTLGQIFSLPINVLMMPLVLVISSFGRFLNVSIQSIPQGAIDGYNLKPTLNKDLSIWESVLATPAYSLGFGLGFVGRGIQFVSYDALKSIFHGVFDGFRFVDSIYPAAFLQTTESKEKTESSSPSNPISYYLIGFPLGTGIKFLSNFISKNVENILASGQFWYDRLWADKKAPVATSSSISGLIGSVLGHLLGLSYFILRGCTRLMVETLRGFVHGLTANVEDREKLTSTEKRLSLAGFALGLGLNKIGHWVKDTMIDAFETAKVMTMLPFQLPTKNPSLSIGSVFGAILGFAPLMGTTLYRFIVENAKSLASIPSYMKNNAYPLELGRKYFEQYGFGCIGFGLGYTCFLIKNALLIAAYVGLGSILAGIKAISIKINPRFTSEVNEKLGAKKNTFHELYAELNNINRQFPEETPIAPANLAGGKGFYAFMGKIMDLNTPSLSEKLLDKSLQIFLGNPEVNREDFNQQLQQDETIDADFDKNQAHIVSTLFKAS